MFKMITRPARLRDVSHVAGRAIARTNKQIKRPIRLNLETK